MPTAFPDVWLERLKVHPSDDAVIVECRFGGTQGGSWAEIAPAGKKFAVQAVLSTTRADIAIELTQQTQF